MTNLLTKIIADFSTTLTAKTAVGATTATLTSGLDADGVQLPTATYGFTIDRNNANKEYFTATLTGSSLTNIKTVTRGTGAGTAGLVNTHRKGAEVIISDWVAMKRMLDILDGTTSFDASTPLGYDGTATISTNNQFATKAYADGIAIAGGADSSTTTKGITKMSVAPASAANPIAVGDNDPRVPTQNENDALVGTSGTAVSSSNKLVDADDVSSAAASGKIVRATGTALPALSGENLTKIQSLTRVAGYTSASNTTENTVFSTTITGGLLSSTGMIRVRVPVTVGEDNNGSTGETFTLRLKYGGSTLQTTTITLTKTPAGQTGYGFIDAWLVNNAATNSQNVSFMTTLGIFTSSTAAPIGFSHAADTTSAIDTTSNQTLALTVQRTDGTNGSMAFRQGIIETIYK